MFIKRIFLGENSMFILSNKLSSPADFVVNKQTKYTKINDRVYKYTIFDG
jgi:hypothetical protein